MAAVATKAGHLILVQIGDGASPETFAEDCLINAERGIVFNADTTEEIVPDCTNPDDPAWKLVFKDGLSATISGNGKLHTTSISTWNTWFASDDAKNVRFNVSGVGYWSGAFKLTAWTPVDNVARKALATSTVTLMSHGEVTWTAA
jgi:hypothetical protein